MNEGYRQLAAAVIHQAIREWYSLGHIGRVKLKRIRALQRMRARCYYRRHAIKARRTLPHRYLISGECGYTCPRSELIAFFHGEWCNSLLMILEIERGDLKAIGVPTDKNI